MKRKIIGGLILGVIILGVFFAGAMRLPGKVSGVEDAAKIAVIHIEGIITGGASGGLLGLQSGSDNVMAQIREAAKDPSVKAVIIRLNSPGGSAAASQEIGEEVEKLRRSGKKVVASMGDTAASGAYWIAAKTDRIVANPATLTGSIGVIMETQNLQGLYDKLGVNTKVFKSGQHKDMGSPNRPITPQEQEIFQSMVNDIYDQFVAVVAEGRKMELEEVKTLADGRVFTGRQAHQLGLVDQLGNYYDAVKLAAKLAGIKGEPVVSEMGKKGFWQDLNISSPGLGQFNKISISPVMTLMPGSFSNNGNLVICP
ncbi:signal peptide peptidase SppA [Desulfolucanica intricata]|uniref:signal peptide peptidase SppA n=1 Tax=Desulfolucanica intricata TaxID=1285191 RepID=UPI0009ECD06D|nr:signal peptide peptidase SppA [Desulfolucanica intricata]